MPSLRLGQQWTLRVTHPQRVGIWLLAGWQAVLSAGIVVPLPRPKARQAERFPCENCPCGCCSAEQCWRQCCCRTNRQKVAWARENGVAVPAFVLAAAEKEAEGGKATCPRCARRAAEQARAACRAGRRHDRPAASAPRRAPGVCWLETLRCRGLAESWQTGVVSLTDDGRAGSVIPPELEGPVRLPPLLGTSGDAAEPPTPPPKAAAG